MSTTINTSNNSSETAKSLGLKIISVVGLTLFAGFYTNNWQRSLAEYAQQQEETVVATSTTDTAPIAANTSTSESTITPSTSVVPPAVDTTQSASVVNTVPAETASVETEVTMAAVPQTQAAPKITNSNTLEKLNSMLYNQIDQAWQQYPTFSENLAYRVTMNSAGMIAEYEHINKAASEYIAETPLAKLANSSTTDANKPTAEYLVLLTPNGVIQVNQWVNQ
ncbi:MAG: hypothetical protein SWX82_28000 [Cyanobacteriota bacterium]|nr:hypothetical protein [Cyanobacteriota bacterium]